MEPERDGTTHDEAADGGPPPPRRHRLRLVVTLSALLAGPLLAEGWMRYRIFRSSVPGDAVRDPRRYADPYNDDDFFKLGYVLNHPSRRLPVPVHDPIMGWLDQSIQPETYRHRDEHSLAGRRPVLLYGASYGKCAAGTECFQDIMESSDLAGEYALLNYSLGNSGFDQMVLMARHSLDLYAHLDPVVVIGAVIETDFDRCMVSFRGWPKPHFSLTDDGGLELDGPVIEGSDAYLREHPIRIRSYLWNHLLYGSELLPESMRAALTNRDEKEALKRELIERLLVALQEELDGRGLDSFFVLFSDQTAMDPRSPVSARQEFITELLEKHGVPYILGRDLLLDAAEAEQRNPRAYFFAAGKTKNHLTTEGNRILFEGIRKGLDGEFDGGADGSVAR